MASRKDQVVHATNAKNKDILTLSGGTLGVITRSKARTLSTVLSILPSTLPKDQQRPRHKLLITLASLRAPREESRVL
ncbi:hypothetical protein FF2_031993 [Malus domestica]